jgi:hypothetical protein
MHVGVSVFHRFLGFQLNWPNSRKPSPIQRRGWSASVHNGVSCPVKCSFRSFMRFVKCPNAESACAVLAVASGLVVFKR